MDRASALGDPYGQMNVALRTAMSQGIDGAAMALRTAALANAAMQLALDVDSQPSSGLQLEKAYFYLQLSKRLQRGTPPDQIDKAKVDMIAQRLRIVPRQLPPAALVRLYRAVRDWSPTVEDKAPKERPKEVRLAPSAQ